MLRRLLVTSAIAGAALLAPQVATAAIAQPETQARCLFPTGVGFIDEFCAVKWKAKSKLLGGLSGGLLDPGSATDDGYSPTTVTPTELNSYVHPLIVKVDGYPLITIKGAKGPSHIWLGPDGPIIVDEANIDFIKQRFLVKPECHCEPTVESTTDTGAY